MQNKKYISRKKIKSFIFEEYYNFLNLQKYILIISLKTINFNKYKFVNLEFFSILNKLLLFRKIIFIKNTYLIILNILLINNFLKTF